MIITADGNTNITTTPGKEYAFAATGTFGSGTLSLQYSIDGGSAWATFNDGTVNVTLTAAGGRIVRAPGRTVRFALSGSTNPSINAVLEPTI